MIDREKITTLITQKFPDLKSISFKLGQQEKNSIIENKILPFLFFQNTIDSKRRIINLFLPEASTSINLLPVYITLGFYRKAVNNVLNRYRLNSNFSGQKISVVSNGNIYYIESIDYINEKIYLQTQGSYNFVECSFDDIYLMNWIYSSAQQIFRSIDEFNNLKSKEDNILDFPIKAENEDFKGAILFTSSKKHVKDVLKNVEVGQKRLIKFINIEEVIYDKENDSYKFKPLATSKKVTKKPVSLVIASDSDFRALDIIKNEAIGKYDHINTIVFNNFDDLYYNFFSDDNEEELLYYLNYYFDQIDNGRIMDIYLINKNYNLSLDKYFRKSFSNESRTKLFTWFIDPNERIHLENKQHLLRHNTEFHKISSKGFINVLNDTYKLLNKWKELAKKEFCNGEIIIGPEILYNILSKLNSFYDPEQLINSYLPFATDKLNNLKERWFSSDSDDGLIDETVSHINYLFEIKNEAHNSKLNYFLNNFQSEIKIDNKYRVIVITDKPPETSDKEYFVNKITELNKEIEIDFKHKNENIPELLNLLHLYDYCLLFCYRGKYRTAPLTNIYAKKHVYLLNPKEYHFANYNIENYTLPHIKEMIADNNRLKLLNLPPGLFTKIDFNPPKFICKENESNTLTEFDIKKEKQFDFEAFANSLINSVDKTPKNLNTQNESLYYYYIFMEDGNYYKFPDNKRLFVFDEDLTSIDKAKKPVKEINIGDTIIFLKTDENIEIKDVIYHLLNKSNSFNSVLYYNKKWREVLTQKFIDLDLDLNKLNLVLNEYGIDVSRHVPEYWMSSETTLPQKFDNILLALANMELIEKSEIPKYRDSVKQIKKIQITFVRELIKKIIAEVENIPYIPSNPLIDKNLLDEFIEHIEIKKVKNVIKI